MKSFTEIAAEAYNLNEQISKEYYFLDFDNTKMVLGYRCPVCKENTLRTDYSDKFLISCNNYDCNFKKEI